MSSHRKQNNFNYHKIYPMSVGEDSSFCHYCGRLAGLERELHWDHVPPLNVKVPPEYIQLIKKTLIRACSECNLLASDRPHMEYIERHIWLKNEYLQRYKKLILAGKHDLLSFKNNDLIVAYINNSIVRYEEILYAIGFGLADLSQITSPVLYMKDDNGNYIADIINKYLSLPIIQNDPDNSIETYPNLDRFFTILFSDFAGKFKDLNKKNYDLMYQRYSYRVEDLTLPTNPNIEYNLSWEEIQKIIEYIEVYKNEEKDYSIQDFIDILNNNNNNNYLSYQEFIEELANVIDNCVKNPITLEVYDFTHESDFKLWYNNHKSLLNQLGVPTSPCLIYKKKWIDISKDLNLLVQKSVEEPEPTAKVKLVEEPEPTAKVKLVEELKSTAKVKLELPQANTINKNIDVINWSSYFEEKVKFHTKVRLTKSFFKDEEGTSTGNLVRFIVETKNKEGIIDCYENGNISINIYDFHEHTEIYKCSLLPHEIEKIKQNFMSLVELIK